MITESKQPMLSRVAKIRSWYGKYERPISSISLVGGFVFDAITLKRVDLFWENFWVVAHLVIVGACIVLVHAIEKGEGDETNPSKTHFWLVNILQFFFGGILSTYLVFYFRSSDITAAWPFILILGLSFWANEALKKNFVRMSFQIALFYLSIFSFSIFLVPILLHSMSDGIFLLAGGASLVFIALFLAVINLVNKEQFKRSRIRVFSLVLGVFVLINALYFTNFIPPIPLSLKDAGVYYSISRDAQGNYLGVAEDSSWWNYFHLYPDFHEVGGAPIFVYSAIFAPTKINTTVIHEWQYQEAKTGQWKTIERVSLKVFGGRDSGFRTYSEKTKGLEPGHWRVNVLTTRGQVIGRVRFNLVLADALPHVIQKVNN